MRLRTLPLDMRGRRWGRNGRRRGEPIRGTTGHSRPAGLFEHGKQPVVIDTAGGRKYCLTRVIRPLVERAEVTNAERGHGVARPQNGVAVRVCAPEGRVVQLEDEVI